MNFFQRLKKKYEYAKIMTRPRDGQGFQKRMIYMEEQLQPYQNRMPAVGQDVFIAPGAQVIGDVELKDGVSIWHNAVLRGDEAKITVGRDSNVQDNSTLHCDKGQELTVGENVTVGHNAILHSCTVGDGSLIGMGAILLNGVVVGKSCLIAAGALLTPRTIVPDNSMVMGSPAKVKRELSPEEIKGMLDNAAEYVSLGREYRE